MKHFSDRFNVQDFIIFDEVHKLAGLSEGGSWYLADAEGLEIPEVAPEDEDWQKLWTSFYHAISIDERKNDKCRRNHMPMRFWSHLTEFQPRNQKAANDKPRLCAGA
jgi:probable DNA metabolism protein